MQQQSQRFSSFIQRRFSVYLNCCDEFNHQLNLKTADALQHKHIKINHYQINALIIDIDRADDALCFEDGRLPPPTWVTINKKTGHSHICWMLSQPVTTDKKAKCYKWFEAIRRGFNRRINGDRNYNNSFTRNPIYQDHILTLFSENVYSLNELDATLDFEDKAPYLDKAPYFLSSVSDSDGENGAEGRNCCLFNTLRKIAYRLVKHCDPLTFQDVVRERANEINCTYPESLNDNEVSHIVKSIVNYCLMNKNSFSMMKEKKGVAARVQHCRRYSSEKSMQSRKKVWRWWRQHRHIDNVTKAAAEAGVDRKTARKHLAGIKLLNQRFKALLDRVMGVGKSNAAISVYIYLHIYVRVRASQSIKVGTVARLDQPSSWLHE